MSKGSTPKRVRATVSRAERAAQEIAQRSRPWTPMTVFAWALLDGPAVGGVWAALNVKRLRLDNLLWPTLLMGFIGFAGPFMLIQLLGLHAASIAAVNWMLVFRVVAAYYFLLTQREAYWEFEDAGGKKANPVVPALLCAALFFFQFIFLLPFVR